MKNKRIGKYVTLMAVAIIGTGTILDLAGSLNIASAAETSTVAEIEVPPAIILNGETTDKEYTVVAQDDIPGTRSELKLDLSFKYVMKFEGNGDFEINETKYEVRDGKLSDGSTELECDFKIGDIIKLKGDDGGLVIHLQALKNTENIESSNSDSSKETEETTNSEISNTESSSKDSESGTTDTSKTETTESSKEPEKTAEKERFEWVAEKDSTYQISLPQNIMGMLNNFDININGKTQKIKMNKEGLWLFEPTNTNQLVIKLKKGDKIDASSRVGIKNLNEIHSIGIWASTTALEVAAISYDPETQTISGDIKKADKTWNVYETGKKISITISKNQETVNIKGEKYKLNWEDGVLMNIENTWKNLSYQNSNVDNLLKSYPVFDKNTDRITTYRMLDDSDLDSILQYDENNKLMQDKIKFDYTNNSFSVNWEKISTISGQQAVAYTIKLPDDFKNTEIFKKQKGKINHTTVVRKAEYGGYMILVIYFRINNDNTMTIVIEGLGNKSKGTREFGDITLSLSTDSEKKMVTEKPVKKTTVKEEVPKTGSNLANGAVFGTAGLALSLVLLIRKKFPIN